MRWSTKIYIIYVYIYIYAYEPFWHNFKIEFVNNTEKVVLEANPLFQIRHQSVQYNANGFAKSVSQQQSSLTQQPVNLLSLNQNVTFKRISSKRQTKTHTVVHTSAWTKKFDYFCTHTTY